MKPKYIIGAGIIIVFIIWAFISFNKTLTPYVSIAQARELASTVQVKGMRIGESSYDVEKNVLLPSFVNSGLDIKSTPGGGLISSVETFETFYLSLKEESS